MCKKLVQEYRAWLEELLEIVELVCENVVPAGHLDRDIHWRTKELWENVEQLRLAGKKQRQENLLLQYQRDGRALLAPVKAAMEDILAKNVSAAKAGNAPDGGGKTSDETGELPEEFRIALRRAYASDILNSLQMLVNLNYLAEEYLDCGLEKVSEIFETDTLDGVKRVRSGVMVAAKCSVSLVPKLSEHGYETRGVRVFRISVAG